MRPVVRWTLSLSLSTAASVAATTVATAQPAPEAPEPPDPLATPRPILGVAQTAASPLRFDLGRWCTSAEIHAAFDGRVGATSAFALDREGTPSADGAVVSPRARISVTIANSPRAPLRARAEYEQDLPTGELDRTVPAGLGMPDAADLAAPLRKASLQLTYRQLIVGGGVTTSHWGLGLVANDGAHGWEPGSARFIDPRGGSRVLRAYAATGPYTRHGLVIGVAAEQVLDDDTLLTARELATADGAPADGDTARQAIALATLGLPTANWAGVYAVYRDQETADGRTLHATVLDASTIRRLRVGPAAVMIGAEVAYIRGDTTFAPTIAHPEETVGQVGAALRGTVDLGRWGGALDALFASGDANLDDGEQHAFHASPNYDVGFILFPQVLAAQSARGNATAGDPNLVGVPATGVERVPTRGSATNTIAVFPRAYVRPTRGVELYGGPLFAWTATDLVDPFNTMVAGGTPTNAVGGAPGRYLGTELDVGARARLIVWGAELQLGLEAGALVPGAALRDAMGKSLGTVTSVRGMLGVRL